MPTFGFDTTSAVEPSDKATRVPDARRLVARLEETSRHRIPHGAGPDEAEPHAQS
jgi:hypothetical protein